MNFLAHIYLSDNQEHLLLGNFLADFITNKEVEKLPRPVQEGVRLHRKIDSFTDQHPKVLDSVRRLRPRHGRYAPVLLDVCFDYILAKNWGRYSEVPLGEFTQGVYRILANNLSLMPPFLHERLPKMINDDWLQKYGTEEGLRFTFSRMKERASRPTFFENVFESLLLDYQLYEQDFNLFFPDVMLKVKDWSLRSE